MPVQQLRSSGVFGMSELEMQANLRWSQWVVVYGYDVKEIEASLARNASKPSIVTMLFDVLASYGNVLEYAHGAGNWVFFRSTMLSL